MQKGCSLLPHRLFWIDNFVIVTNVHVTFLLLSWAGLSSGRNKLRSSSFRVHLQTERRRCVQSLAGLRVPPRRWMADLSERPAWEGSRCRRRAFSLSVSPGFDFHFCAVAQNHGRSDVLLWRPNAIKCVMDFRVPFPSVCPEFMLLLIAIRMRTHPLHPLIH